MQIKTSLRMKIWETVCPGSHSVSSAALITLITAIMSYRFGSNDAGERPKDICKKQALGHTSKWSATIIL